MSPVRITWARTLGQAKHSPGTALAIGGGLAAIGVRLAFAIGAAEGSRQTLPEIWAGAAALVMPVMSALLAMGVWSDERKSGRICMLLTAPAGERDLTLGKHLGVWTLAAAAAAVSLGGFLGALRWLAPAALSGYSSLDFAPALLGVWLQCALWCAVGVAASAWTRTAALAAGVAVALTLVLPVGGWAGLMAWSDAGRIAFGLDPVTAQALDMAAGTVAFSTLALHAAGVAAMLFIAAKTVETLRLGGSGGLAARGASALSRLLAAACAALLAALAYRVDFTLDLPAGFHASRLSMRTLDVLRESEGIVDVTCFLPRSDRNFRQTSQFLRLLQRESKALGGAEFNLQYVDPRWDVGAAERLIDRGVAENCLVFERGRRMATVPLANGAGERECVSAVRRLATVPRRRQIYWTVGHGEARFDEYGPLGMSDIARSLVREGFGNRALDLAAAPQIPGDCALVVVAGAKDAFSRVELGRLEDYLRDGGRVMALVGSSVDGGIAPLLPAWGVRIASPAPVVGPTLTGTDVIVGDFSQHPLSAPLKGSRIILDRPVAFAPSAAAETEPVAGRIEYSPLARSGGKDLAVAVERGGAAGRDLAIRPARIVAVGDDTFAMNATLAAKANANCDFFLNCAAHLAGMDAIGSTGVEYGTFSSGLDREGQFELMLQLAVALPVGAGLLLAIPAWRRRRRT